MRLPPQNATRTNAHSPYTTVARPVVDGYAAAALLAFLALALVQFAALPKPLSRQERSRCRPLGELIRQPALVVAVLCAMVAYGAMNLIMVDRKSTRLNSSH